jgi:cytochrome c oxidase accessory protein FixG
MSDAAIAIEDARSFKELKRDPLYADRVKVYPKEVGGRFRTIKWAALILLLGIYYLAPWLRWDRGPGVPDQAFLIDMPGRRAYFLWIEIWPQEVYYLTGLLLLGAFGLFLATSIAGRVWCGFTCPQTVWTDLFMWVERRIEGDRGTRIRLDRAPLSREKILKKLAKHAAWLLIAALTGGAWIMYFNDAPTVTRAILTGNASFAQYFFFGLFTATTYLLAGWAREQVCTYMCPWPRFQAALLDEHSYVVTYQKWRGEPRAPLKKNPDWSGRGDCIACNQCVAVCPMGIDIREGLQLECIGCGLCIDACNDVMHRIGRPRELITMDTERNQALRAAGKPPVHPIVRPRTVIYAAMLLVVAGVILYGFGRARCGRHQHPARAQSVVRHPFRWQHPQRLYDQDSEQEPRPAHLRSDTRASRRSDAVRGRPGRLRVEPCRAVGQAGHRDRLSDLCDCPAGRGE